MGLLCDTSAPHAVLLEIREIVGDLTHMHTECTAVHSVSRPVQYCAPASVAA